VAPDAERFADLRVQIHADLVPGAGALGGLYTALEVSSAEQVIVVACDLPFLDAGLLARLAERAPGGDGAWVKTARGVEPFFACYRREARGVMLEAIRAGRLRIADLEHTLRMVPIEAAELEEFGAPEHLLANVNAADDYERIR
jgi:molybdopterin-guanine dinucleotide biosynthesis protein A